jgi:hypothetical protein
MNNLKTLAGVAAAVLVLTGCATNDSSTGSAAAPSRFRATDGREIEIGKAMAANGGRTFRNPHMEKAWVADGFNFNGYDTLYIAPVKSTAKYQPDEEMPHAVAKERLPMELASALKSTGVFANVVTNEADIKPGAKVLRLEQTITEYSKGGGAARYFVGLYGGGQPVLRVVGAAKDQDKDMFTYEMRRSGVSAGARMIGAFKTDVDIQSEDIRSLALDLSDFVSAIAGKYQAR